MAANFKTRECEHCECEFRSYKGAKLCPYCRRCEKNHQRSAWNENEHGQLVQDMDDVDRMVHMAMRDALE